MSTALVLKVKTVKRHNNHQLMSKDKSMQTHQPFRQDPGLVVFKEQHHTSVVMFFIHEEV